MPERDYILPSSLYLYSCSQPPDFEIEEIKTYLEINLPPTKIETRGDFFLRLLKEFNVEIETIARRIALCKVHSLNQMIEESTPLEGEIIYEKRRILENKGTRGVIYDGFRFQRMCREFMERDELRLSLCHIIFTNQLLATFDENDRRYHLRVGIYGIPNIISTSGLIEALARPREYYFRMQMGLSSLNSSQEIITSEDERITELLKGYCLQALFYHITQEAFCLDKDCRLYNAHWQKEAIQAQILGEYEFCPKHAEIISRWKGEK